MRGRKPKPTQQRVLEGNPGKRPINSQEPNLPPTSDAVPAELLGDPRAVAEWSRVAPMLVKSGVLTEADRGALLSLCQQWSLYIEARAKATSLVVTTKSGHPMPNPYLSVSNKALSHCIKLWAELGCTPSARSRVARVEGESADPFAEFDHASEHAPATH